jgi:hypothetical protein
LIFPNLDLLTTIQARSDSATPNVTYLNGKSPDVGEWNIAALLVQPVKERAQGRQLN